MFQGETITTVITGFPIPISEIKDLRIVFKNNLQQTLIEKTLADCKQLEASVEFTLSQQESLLLSSGRIMRSVVVITKNGDRLESCPSEFVCNRTAKNEVIL